MNLPRFEGSCLGCGECVSVCPGLAINLVFNDYDPSGKSALLMLPFEFAVERVPLGSEVHTVDLDGNRVGTGKVVAIRRREKQDRRHLLLVEVPSCGQAESRGLYDSGAFGAGYRPERYLRRRTRSCAGASACARARL